MRAMASQIMSRNPMLKAMEGMVSQLHIWKLLQIGYAALRIVGVSLNNEMGPII